jgi:hypothetical protein
MEQQDEPTAADKLIAAGSDIAGAVITGAAGLMLAGPEGVVVGGIGGPLITRALRRVAHEVRHRMLGPREEVRIGAVLAFAAARISERLDEGEQVRQDDFFDDAPGNRSTAKELTEAVVFAAQREHEEKKLKFQGRLLANIAFRDWIDRAQANLLIRLGSVLSYQQLCLLAILGQTEKYPLRLEDYQASTTMSTNTVAVLQELLDLDARGMVNAGRVFFGITNIAPGLLKLEGTGATLFELMELKDVDTKDLQRVVSLLQ